jgi:hypothetical protein
MGDLEQRVVAFSGTGTFTIHNELERTGRLTNVTGSNLQYASGATLKYNPNNNQNVFGEWPASSGPTNVIKQGSNTITLTSSAGDRTIPLGGVLQIGGGTFTIGSSVTLTVNGALRRNGGSLTKNGTLTYGTTGTQNVDGKSYTGAVLWYSAAQRLAQNSLLLLQCQTCSSQQAAPCRGVVTAPCKAYLE